MPDPTPPADSHAEGDVARTYDEVLYVGQPYAKTHPDRLATLATLHGMEPASVQNCRVLEIGCGDGANLVPMAAALPRSKFVGIDFAAQPVARAQRMARDLDLENVRIMQRDLRDFPQDAGPFDFIIAHGFYSWIPPDVRRLLMPVIARHLAPNGIAYVSYNLFPGCKVRQAVWDMLKFHTKDCTDLRSKLVAARSLIALMANSGSTSDDGENTLRLEFQKLTQVSDSALCHDDLNAINTPVYFGDFVADAAASGLAYLVDSDLVAVSTGDFGPNVHDMLGRMDRLAVEQYLDFLRFRPFRSSLLCRAPALPEFRLRPEGVAAMRASPSLVVRRARAANQSITYTSDHARAVVEYLLQRWPGNVLATELAAMLGDRSPHTRADVGDSASTYAMLAELYLSGVVDLRARDVSPALGASERPVVFAPARWMGRDADVVPNLYHDGVQLGDPVGRKLVTLLDGTRTRADVLAALGGVRAGPANAQHIDAAIAGLAQRAMLVA